MAGIKEIKDVLAAAEAITVDAISAAKDGIGIEDITVFTNNFDKIAAAYENYNLIPEEIADLDQAEILELITGRIAFVYLVLAALNSNKDEKPTEAPVE